MDERINQQIRTLKAEIQELEKDRPEFFASRAECGKDLKRISAIIERRKMIRHLKARMGKEHKSEFHKFLLGE